MVKVLLYSGGLDSYCLKFLVNPDILLYVNFGTEDGIKEISNLKNSGEDVTFVDSTFMKQYELDNKIIPFRNHMLVLIAAQYGNEIYLGATEGDTTKDKDFVFKSQMESILNYFSLDKDKVKVRDYPYKVELPLKNMTKSEIVREYLIKGGKAEHLLKDSRSCYKGTIKECGVCRSCLRKAVALLKNSISIKDYFEENPLENISKENHKKMISRGREGKDYEIVSGRV